MDGCAVCISSSVAQLTLGEEPFHSHRKTEGSESDKTAPWSGLATSHLASSLPLSLSNFYTRLADN